MKGTFSEQHVVGAALLPTVFTAGTYTTGGLGVAIANPHLTGRLLSFILLGDALASVSVLTVKLLGSSDGGSTYAQLLDKNGTGIQFTATKTIDGAELDSGAILGTIDLTRFTSNGASSGTTNGVTHFKLQVTTVTGGTATIAAAYVISELYEVPDTTKTDDFQAKQIPLP